MAFLHGKDTVITLDGNDLSAFVTTSQLERTQDSHEVTTYGKDSHVFAGGLMNATFTMSGVYDNGASGPRDIIEPLIGAGIVVLTRKPEGTGSGLPLDTVNALVTKYTETSPVADMVTWSCDLQLSDDVASTNQA